MARRWKPAREKHIQEALNIQRNAHFAEGYAVGAELARMNYPRRLLEWAKTREHPVIVAIGRDAIPLLKTLHIERKLLDADVPLKFFGISGDNAEIRSIKRAVEELRGTRLEDMIYEYGRLVPRTAGRQRLRMIKQTKEELLWELHEMERAAGIKSSTKLAKHVDDLAKDVGAENVILADWAHIGTHPILLTLGLRKLGQDIQNIHTSLALAKEPADRIHEVVGAAIDPRDKNAMRVANISEFVPKIMGPYVQPNRPREYRPENIPAWKEFIHGVELGYISKRGASARGRKR